MSRDKGKSGKRGRMERSGVGVWDGFGLDV